MTGVPAAGADLRRSSPQILEILKAWLNFYRENKTQLATGRFTPFGQLEIPNHKIEAEDRTFAYVRNLEFSELPVEGSTISLINATDADHLTGRLKGPGGTRTYQVQIYSYLQPEPGELQLTTDSTGALDFDFGVQQGGLVVLTAN
jgi:hypothetical protein